jgi:MFS family permease
MKRVRMGRVAVGGSVAAVIIAGVAGYLPGVILAVDLRSWHQSLGTLYRPPPPSVSLIFFTLMAWVFGVTAVWMYAAAAPADESGPRTALKAGLWLWSAGWLTAALGHIALGDYPYYNLAIVPCVCGFGGAVLGTLAGAAVYDGGSGPRRDSPRGRRRPGPH